MQSTIRDVDTIARLGGDEFGMLLFDVKDRINVSNLAEMLLEEISKPILYGEEILNIGASIGIAFYNEKTKDAKELVSQADTAMYQAKTAGRNTYSYFEKVTSLTNVTDINTKI